MEEVTSHVGLFAEVTGRTPIVSVPVWRALAVVCPVLLDIDVMPAVKPWLVEPKGLDAWLNDVSVWNCCFASRADYRMQDQERLLRFLLDGRLPNKLFRSLTRFVTDINFWAALEVLRDELRWPDVPDHG